MVDDMFEKSDFDKAPINLAIIGRGILTSDIFDLLKPRRRRNLVNQRTFKTCKGVEGDCV